MRRRREDAGSGGRRHISKNDAWRSLKGCSLLRCTLAAMLLLIGAAPAAAERNWHGTLYGAKWVHENLGDVFWRGARNDLEWWDQYFVGVGLSRVLLQDFSFPINAIGRGSIELEGTYVYHFGEMEHPEITGALLWRTPDLALFGPLSVNAAAGKGLSYAFKAPSLETEQSNHSAQRLMTFLAFELEFQHASMPNMSLVPRLHHRSGMYGVVGPRGDGSNYVGLGLRVSVP
jgi:hypothetical protein